jgi:hypothetical protein
VLALASGLTRCGHREAAPSSTTHQLELVVAAPQSVRVALPQVKMLGGSLDAASYVVQLDGTAEQTHQVQEFLKQSA